MKHDFSAHEWLENSPPESIKRLQSKLKPMSFKKNSWVHRVGDAANGLFFIDEGTVRFSATDKNGKELIVRDLTSGAWFGFIGCFGSGVRPNDAIALSDTQLLFVSLEDFETVAASDYTMWQSATKILAKYVEFYYHNYENALFLPLSERLESTIKQLCEWQNSALIKISQSELAGILGATKEAVGVNLNMLQAQGTVELGYRNIRYKHFNNE